MDMIRIAPLALAVLLAACGRDAEPTSGAASQQSAPGATSASATPSAPAASSEPSEVPALAIESEGLRLFDRQSGSANPILFGADWQQVRAALGFRGPPGTGTNGECGAGPLDYASWPDGLTLYAQNGKFVGWAADQRGTGAIATAANIGPGSTRAQLEDAYVASVSRTTLGTEFAAGDLYGLLDGPGAGARITNMWAGVSCNFR